MRYGVKRILNMAITFVLLLFVSCNWNPIDPDNNNDDTDTTETWPDPIVLQPHENLNLFPIAECNSWTFQFRSWDSWTGTYNIVEQTFKLSKYIYNDTSEYFQFDNPPPFFPSLNARINEIGDCDSIRIRNNDFGDILMLIGTESWPLLIFDTNDIGKYKELKLRNLKWYMMIKSIGDTVITPIDTFYNCYKISTEIPQVIGSSFYTWFVPEYGPVKIYHPENGATYELSGINLQDK